MKYIVHLETPTEIHELEFNKMWEVGEFICDIWNLKPEETITIKVQPNENPSA